MEQLIAGLLEKSLVGGAFVYMLHYFLGRFSTTLEEVSITMSGVLTTLGDISDTMQNMDARITKLEERD